MKEKSKIKDVVISENVDVNNRKWNKKFLLLSVFGIIFVVMGHYGGVNSFLNNVFPFYSFHMALFAFVSGYFFKDRKISEFLINKTKKLILVYLVWNFIYGIIISILKKVGIINFGEELSLYNIFISPFWSNSNQFYFNVAAWFVIAIYFIQVIYFFLNKILNKVFKLKTEIIIVIVSTIIAILELNMLLNGNLNGNYKFLLTRVVFLMPFYAMGQIYKKIEKYDKINNIVYFAVILLVQLVLTNRFKIITYNLNILEFLHKNYLVYLTSSMTGIMFWLRISSIFEKTFENNNIINYIGNNTFTIMMHHVFSVFVINLLIFVANNITGRLSNFDLVEFKTSVWYTYNNGNPVLKIFYLIIAISLPLLFKYYIYDKIKLKIQNFYLKSKCKLKKN